VIYLEKNIMNKNYLELKSKKNECLKILGLYLNNLILNWRKGSPQETRPERENSSLGFIEAVHQW